MSEPHKLHCYEYVTVPYDAVKAALARDAAGVSTLRVSVGALEIGTDVKIEVRSVHDRVSAVGEPRTDVELAWSATRAAALFPVMEATLSVYPISAHETQLDLSGRYRPPLGAAGSAFDAVVGHRLAEKSVLRFVQELAARLSAELGGTAAGHSLR